MGKKQTRKQKSSNKSEAKKASKNANGGLTTVGGGTPTHISFQRDIIWEILSRLPVKSLLRFRSISKPWQAIIDNNNPSFSDSHLTCSQARHGGGRLLLSFSNFNGSKHYFYSSGLGGGEAVRDLSLPGCHKGSNNTPCQCYVSESINGVICFFNGSQVYVCNPSTRDIVTMPPIAETRNEKHDSFFDVPYSSFSFGFDSSAKEYKVLHVVGMRYRNTTWVYDLQCHVLTVRATKEANDELKSSNLPWRKISYVPPSPYMFESQGVCVNGAIYWISKNACATKILVAFNVATEKFHLTLLPIDNMPSKLNLSQIRGRLAVMGYDDWANNFIVWVLEDYHKLLWIKKSIDIVPPQNHKGEKVLVLVGTDYTGDMFLTQSSFVNHYDHIPCCHENRTARARTIRVGGLPPWIDLHGAKKINFRIANHVESLVPLAPIDVQFGDFVVHPDA